MKKIIFIFLVLPLAVFSQTGRIEIGYQNAFNYTGALTDIANRYKTSRPWLENEMKLPKLHNGISFGAFAEPSKFSIGFTLSYLWYTGKTSGTDNTGNEFDRKLRSHLFTLELFDMSYNFIQTERFRFGLGFVPFTASRGRISTKLDDNDWVYATKIGLTSNAKKAHWFAGLKAQTHVGVNISETLMVKFTFFYQLNYTGKMNLLFVDESLNPRTAGAFYNSHNFKNPSYFGMRVSLNILTD